MTVPTKKPRQVDAAVESTDITDSSRIPFCLSLVTAADPINIGKRFTLKDGKLMKRPGGVLNRGRSERMTFTSLTDFAEFLPTLDARHALMYGLAPGRDVKLVTKRKYEKRASRGTTEGIYYRGKGMIVWRAEPGLWMIDYDPEPDAEPMSREAFMARLAKAVPELAGAGYVYFPSSSSHITNSETCEDLTGLRGFRVWFLVNDANGIPGAGEALMARLWLAGEGYIKISKSGAMLKRTLVDGAVWQPERLDFAGGAACGRGLHQDRGTPFVVEGSVVDVSAFVDAEVAA